MNKKLYLKYQLLTTLGILGLINVLTQYTIGQGQVGLIMTGVNILFVFTIGKLLSVTAILITLKIFTVILNLSIVWLVLGLWYRSKFKKAETEINKTSAI